jgi:NAD+ synthase (glutamine-hydrolysing)
LVDLLVFPELCVTGYSCGELFLSDILKESVYKALDVIRKSTIGKKSLFLSDLQYGKKANFIPVLLHFKTTKF